MNSAKTPEQALCHLFFHCCNKDSVFDKKEIDKVASLFVELDMNRSLDFKDEVLRYREDVRKGSAGNGYVKNLIVIIRPVNTLALFSWCVELCLSDELLSMDERGLLENIADALSIENSQKDAIIAVMVERKVAQLNKII